MARIVSFFMFIHAPNTTRLPGSISELTVIVMGIIMMPLLQYHVPGIVRLG